jgi:hypothetical protein
MLDAPTAALHEIEGTSCSGDRLGCYSTRDAADFILRMALRRVAR